MIKFLNLICISLFPLNVFFFVFGMFSGNYFSAFLNLLAIGLNFTKVTNLIINRRLD